MRYVRRLAEARIQPCELPEPCSVNTCTHHISLQGEQFSRALSRLAQQKKSPDDCERVSLLKIF
jgi:hypothetical protein